MSNKNDRWSALSMKERADLMNMYITNGISDLKEMKKHYNSFSGGGRILDGESETDTSNSNPYNYSYLTKFNNEKLNQVVKNLYVKDESGNLIKDENGNLIPNMLGKEFVKNTNAVKDNSNFKTYYSDSSNLGTLNNSQAAKHFLVDWYNSDATKNIIKEEAKIAGTDKIIFQNIPHTDENYEEHYYTPTQDEAIAYRSLLAANVPEFINSDLEPGVLGVYMNNNAIGNGINFNDGYNTVYKSYGEKPSYYSGPQITYTPKVNDTVKYPWIALHEFNHAFQDHLLPSYFKDYSLPHDDRKHEMHSYLMTLRAALGLSPDKRDYTPEDAQKMIETVREAEKNAAGGADASKLLDVINDDSSVLAHMLNTWAAFTPSDQLLTHGFDSEGNEKKYNILNTIKRKNSINAKSKGGKLNVFSGEEDTNSKTKLEAVMRSTNGITGEIFTKTPPFINIPNIVLGARAYSKMLQDNPEMPSTSSDYTGAAIIDGIYSTDDELGFATTDELIKKLGEKPTDFVDSYVYGSIPFEKQGVIKKTSTPEKHIYRTKLASMNREVPVYQTHKDTLNTKLVKDLNTKLSKGQVDLLEKNFTYKDSPFQIGDTGIYYDGNNGFVARVILEDGTVTEKALDIYDFTPSEWNYNVGEKAKEGLEFINKNGHPYLMTSPWYYKKDTRTEEQRLKSMGITLNKDGEVIRNVGDASGKVWDLYDALDFISSHPYETRLENGKIL